MSIFDFFRVADRLTHNGKTWRPFEGGRKRCSLRGFLGSKECRHFVMLSGFPFLFTYLTKINLRGSSARVVAAPTSTGARVCSDCHRRFLPK
jgi:hypothetical protein